MANYCYYCGERTQKGKYCEKCGTDTDPSRDVYFTEEECGDCDEPLPRWANFCPKCGRSFGHYDPTDPQRKKRYNQRQIIGGIIWSCIFLAIAIILSLVEETIPLKYPLGAAGFFIIIIWLNVIFRWERGRFRDGTIIGHYTEKTSRRERDGDKTNLFGRPLYYEIPVTVYCTTIRWDDGSEEAKKLEDCAADHEQLKEGNRIRYYEASRTYRKL